MRVLPALLLVATAALAPGARAEDPPPKPAPPAGLRRSKAFTDAVDRAIGRGTQFLRTLQLADGSFGLRPIPMFWVSGEGSLGPTALAVYTLRACGAPADDPAVKRGLQRLREMYDSKKRGAKGLDNYGVSLTLLALEAQYAAEEATGTGAGARRIPEADLEWMRELARWLVGAQTKDGAFSYWSPARGGNWDHSNVQFSLLALKAARRCGIEIPRTLWARAADHLLDEQESKGPSVGRYEPGSPYGEMARDGARGWGYTRNTAATGSMTAGCLSALVICRSELLGWAAYSSALDARVLQAIHDGAAWLGVRFTVEENPGPAGTPAVKEAWHYYYLYALERAGVLGGVEWMGEHDWYGKGAEYLLKEQLGSGAWSQRAGSVPRAVPLARPNPVDDSNSVLSTCFALLFLKKGTAPVTRGALTKEFDDGDINFAAAGALSDADFDDFLDLVLSRWRRAAGDASKDRLLASATAVGPRIVLPLVDRLSSTKESERAAAIALLSRATGLDHGYAAAAPPDEREAAATRWQAWWLANGKSLRYDAARKRLVVL